MIRLADFLCCCSAISAIALSSCNTSVILCSDKTQRRPVEQFHLFCHVRMSSLPSSVSHWDSSLLLHLLLSAPAETSGADELLAAVLLARTSRVWPLLHRRLLPASRHVASTSQGSWMDAMTTITALPKHCSALCAVQRSGVLCDVWRPGANYSRVSRGSTHPEDPLSTPKQNLRALKFTQRDNSHWNPPDHPF